MALIITSGDTSFTLNGIEYPRIYQPLKQGINQVGMYNIYDVRNQLKNSTNFGEYEIDGVTYTSQTETISALLGVIYDSRVEVGISQSQINNWDSGYDNQITGLSVSTGFTKTITLTQQDGDTLTADFDDLVIPDTNTDNFISSVEFTPVDGELSMSYISGGTINTNLDGRYLQPSDISTYLQSGDNVSELINDVGYITFTNIPNNDDFVIAGLYSGGTLELYRFSGSTVSIDFSGLTEEYSVTGHTHTISDITDFTDNSTNWNSAYDDTITGITVTGSATKTITLTQQDGGTLTANFTDNTGGGGGSGDVVTGMTFNTSDGVLTLTTLSGDTVTEDLDGRYLTGFTIPSTYLESGDNISELVNDVGYLTGFTIPSTYLESGDNVSELVNDANYLTTTGDGSGLTNVNADTLDSLDSTQFLRSNVADIKTSGDLTFDDNIMLKFGTSGLTSEISGNATRTIWNLKAGSDLQIRGNGSARFTFERTTGDLIMLGDLTANAIIKDGGTASEFLKADGSVDSNTYLTTIPSTYLESGDNISELVNDVGYITGFTNTTYTAGDGLDLIGTEFSHSDTSSQSSSNNSGRTYIQDILLDSYGHITGLTTSTETVTDTTYGTATSTVQGLIELFSDTVQGATSNAVSSTIGKTYGIQLNGSGQAVVNVPWTDTNTTYSATLTAGTGLAGTTYNPSTSTTFSLDFSELSVGGTLVGTDYLIAENGGVENRQLISNIPLSIFNNDSGFITGFTDTNDNDYITSASFNTGNGILTLTRLSGGTVTQDLDGRYLESIPASYLESGDNISELVNDTGYVTKVGTPVNDQVAVWTGDGTVEGTSGLIYDSVLGRLGVGVTPIANLSVNGNATIKDEITAGSFVKSGGLATEFLKADGSVDSNTYLTTIPASYLESGDNISELVNDTGYISRVGTPLDNQIGVFTGTNLMEGDSDFTWDGSTFTTFNIDANKITTGFQGIEVVGLNPRMIMQNISGSTDSNNSMIYGGDDQLTFRLYSDDYSTFNNAMIFFRTGTNFDELRFNADIFNAQGATSFLGLTARAEFDTLVLGNNETTDATVSGEFAYDLNDVDAGVPAYGPYNSSGPVGVYLSDGTDVRRVWTSDNFDGTQIDGWQDVAINWSGSTPSDYVNLTTAQTIAGLKTFSNTLSADKLWAGNRSGSGTYDLDVSTNENTSGTKYTARIVTQNSQSSLLTFTSRAVNGTANYTGAIEQTGSQIAGIYGTTNSTSGRMNIQAGGDFSSQYSGGVTGVSNTSLYGVRSDVRVTGNGDINHSMAFKANPPTITGTGSVDYNWGLYISDQSNTNANNSSAIHIEGDGSDNSISWSGNDGSDANIKLYSNGTSDLILTGASLTVTGDININSNKKLQLDNSGDTFSFITKDTANTYGKGADANIYASDIGGGHDFINGDDFEYETVTALSFVKDGGTSAQFLKADGTVTTDVMTSTGTPVNNQVAIFTDSNTVEGLSGLTFDGTTFNVGGAVSKNLTITDASEGTGNTYTVISTDYQILADNGNGVTFNLPAASSNSGRILKFTCKSIAFDTDIKISEATGGITTETAGATFTLKITIQSDGTSWYKVG